VTGPSHYRLDLGASTVLALCEHCAWRTITTDRDTARTAAESHLLAVHAGPIADTTRHTINTRRLRA